MLFYSNRTPESAAFLDELGALRRRHPQFELGEAGANRAAWEVLSRFDKPFLTLFGDSDKITRGAEQVLQALVPGARGQRHAVLEKAGHYLLEDVGEVLAERVIDFIEGR